MKNTLNLPVASNCPVYQAHCKVHPFIHRQAIISEEVLETQLESHAVRLMNLHQSGMLCNSRMSDLTPVPVRVQRLQCYNG